VEEVRGHAGWPLNVFISADGYPVTGFTYLPRENFLQVLIELSEQWQLRHESINPVAKAYFEQTESSEQRSTLVSLADQDVSKLLDVFVGQAMTLADELQGGFGHSMKFPSYPQLNSLLKAIRLSPALNKVVAELVQLTLDSLATLHLMDQLNHGFFRYSTDPDWQTPHYEKMLYDNAQLAALYFDAELLWPGRGYAEIGLKTIGFMRQFLSAENGGFMASLSAVDENQREGAGYFWSREELKAALTEEEYNYLKNHWQLEAEKTQEFLLKPLAIADSNGSEEMLQQRIQLKLRQVKKPWMPVDSKILASWNGLALTALVKAQQYKGSQELKVVSTRLFDFIRNQFIQNGQVIRFAGQAESAETTLEDYAQLAYSIQLYALATGDVEAEKLAQRLVQDAFRLFYRDDRWFQDVASLIPGDKGEYVIQDAVLESSSARLLETVMMMKRPDKDLQQRAFEIIPRLTRDMIETPYYYGSSILLASQFRKLAAEKIEAQRAVRSE